MSEMLDFVVRMRDLMSPGFPKMAAAGHSTFKKIDNDIARTQNNMERLGRPVKMKVDTSDLGKANSMLGAIVGGNLIAGGVTKGAAMVKDLLVSSIDAAMQYGMRSKSFEVLTGSATRGRQLASDLRDLKQSTIMGASVYQNAQTLMGFGIGDWEVVKVLHQIGDIAMGDQERMAGLTLAFAQVRAGGKLMGQDLLQFINAGFNPLSVMSEKWKEFGYKQKVTVGQLKDMMSEGKISAAQVGKAFEMATAKGGKFYQMMDQIGETAGGKMAKLKGNWAAFQIDLGNALLPVASSFMEAGGDMLHWLNISKTMPEQLMSEQFEIHALVDSVTKLNQGTELRARLIDMLKGKYPDFFGNLDREKAKNEELLAILDKVNNAYGDRIKYATYKTIADAQRQEINELLSLAMKARAQVGMIRQGGGPQVLSGWDRMKITGTGLVNPLRYGNDTSYWNAFAAAVDKKFPKMQHALNANEMAMKDMDLVKLVGEASALWADPKRQKELWGNSLKKNRSALGREFAIWNTLRNQSGGMMSDLIRGHDWSNMERLVHGGKSEDVASAVDDTTTKITGGGRRQIIINLNQPLIGKQEYHVNSMAEAKEISLREEEEKILRMLQGAANAVS